MSDASNRLSPELEAFLAPERRAPDPAAEMQTEVLSRIGGTLGWFGGPGPGAGGSNPAGGAPLGGQLGGGRLATAGAKQLAAGSLARTVATLVVGGVLGSGVHEAYDRVSARRAERARVAVVAPSVPAPSVPAPTPAPPPAPTPAPEPTVPAGLPVGNPRVEHVARGERGEIREHDRGLAAERGLIEQARTALARDQGSTALAALERHARDYPRGELEEERESLQVQALVGLERFDQARKIGAHFHERFPRSIFAAVVDEALKSIP